MLRRTLVGLLLVLTLGLAAINLGAVGSATTESTPPASDGGVVREVLGTGYPIAAPGQALQLVRFVIEPDTLLPTHVHPGMQVAFIESGYLRYTVLQGEAPIYRAATDDGTPGPVEMLTDGQETIVGPGDWFVEPEGVVHFGHNEGPDQVVILVASLFADDQPPAILVNDEGTPTP